MNRTASLTVVGVAGLVTTGLLALPVASAFAEDDLALKRDDDAPDVVLVADEDDDDTNDESMSTSETTGDSISATDHTDSRQTAVSRDRDLSRGDLTRDWTRDGDGELKRDWSANKTNDRSRNDTRR